MTRHEQIKRLQRNKRILAEQGYVHTCSIMDDCGTGGIFFRHPDGHEAVIRNGKIEYAASATR